MEAIEMDIDFFWDAMSSMGARDGYSMLEEAHEEEVDDAMAMFTAGGPL